MVEVLYCNDKVAEILQNDTIPQRRVGLHKFSMNMHLNRMSQDAARGKKGKTIDLIKSAIEEKSNAKGETAMGK